MWWAGLSWDLLSVPAVFLSPLGKGAKGNPSELVGDNHETDCLIKIKLSNKLAILR